ncbi:MAG: IS3 family transposase [Mariprofundaceae bacterium]|nr:IS3 family transposase [Mariprofundaceae bacterium]
MRLIDEEYTRHPFYGSRKIKRWLIDQGYAVNRKRVQRLMRLMGIQSIAPKSFTSKANKSHKKYPYLIRIIHECCRTLACFFARNESLLKRP